MVAAWGKPKEDFSTDVPGHLKAVDYQSKEITSIGSGEPIGNLDGVEADSQGGYLVTDWFSGGLYHIGEDGKAELLMDLKQGSADHEVVPDENLAIIPMMMEGTVDAYKHRWHVRRVGGVAGWSSAFGSASPSVEADLAPIGRIEAGMATFVLVHGAFHGGWCWRGVTAQLRASRPRGVRADADRPRRAQPSPRPRSISRCTSGTSQICSNGRTCATWCWSVTPTAAW